jgi:hypothetical protein
MNLQEINAKMLVFCKERLAHMGSERGGLLNYYEKRIENGAILNEMDTCIIEEIQKRFAPGTVIHEMACGAAQLGHALSLFGYSVTASEINKERYELAVDLGKYLQSGCQIIRGNSMSIKSNARLYVTVNAVSAYADIKKDMRFFMDRIIRGSQIILNAEKYGDIQNIFPILDKNEIRYTRLLHGFILMGGDNA